MGHVAVLSAESRLDAFSALLLELGCRADDSDEFNAQARRLVLRRCLSVFWWRYPREAFGLITVLVRRILAVDGEFAVDDAEGLSVPQLRLAVECIEEFWVVVRDMADDRTTVDEALKGFERVLGHDVESLPVTTHDFAREVLNSIVLPLLVDTLMRFASFVPEGNVDVFLEVLSSLKEKPLWKDAFAVPSPFCENLL